MRLCLKNNIDSSFLRVALLKSRCIITIISIIILSKKIFNKGNRLFILSYKVLVDEGLNFEQKNFRMADISNLKINERSNVNGRT